MGTNSKNVKGLYFHGLQMCSYLQMKFAAISTYRYTILMHIIFDDNNILPKAHFFLKHNRPDHAHCLNLGLDPGFEAASMLIPLMFTSNWGKAG